MIDIEDIGRKQMRGSAVCYLKAKDGKFIVDENGDKCGIELYNLDSKHGLMAQLAQSRAFAALEEKLKGIESQEEKNVETKIHNDSITKETVMMMFKSSVNLSIGGKPVDESNIEEFLNRLQWHNVRQLMDFIADAESWAGKP